MAKVGKLKTAPVNRKRVVLEELFKKRWDPVQQELRNSMVLLEEVSDQIRECNASFSKPLSAKNPANFLKDIIRKVDAANKAWPNAAFEAGYTGIQRTGAGRCFEFIPIKPGQQIPFVAIPLLTKRRGESMCRVSAFR